MPKIARQGGASNGGPVAASPDQVVTVSQLAALFSQLGLPLSLTGTAGYGGPSESSASTSPTLLGTYGRVHPACQGVASSLLRGRRSVAMQNTGDSTGDGSTEWFGLLGTLLGQNYPAYSVHWRAWNDTNQSYDRAATVLQSGAAGTRYYDIRSSVAFYLPGNNITGDVDLLAHVKPDLWASGAQQTIISKYETNTANRSIFFGLDSTGHLFLTWSADGTATTTVTSTAIVPFADATDGWVRVQHDVDNGAAGNNALFFTSTDGATFTQLGSTVVTGSTTSHFASTASWMLGARIPSSPQTFFTGAIGEVWIMNGLSTAGYHIMPTLPELWEPTGAAGYGGDGYILSGAPVLQLWAGSQSGQGVSYMDNSARRPKVFANVGQSLLLTNIGMNDPGLFSVYATGTFQTWMTNVRTLLPGVPFIVLGQNPVTTGALITLQDSVDQRYARQASVLQWAASGVVAGTYPVEMFSAWPATFTTSLYSDGYLHPASGLTGGSGVEARYLLNYLFNLHS